MSAPLHSKLSVHGFGFRVWGLGSWIFGFQILRNARPASSEYLGWEELEELPTTTDGATVSYTPKPIRIVEVPC